MKVRLLPPSVPVPGAPVEDAAQRAVVERRQGSGPLVVIGAPGTGKTGTLVEAVAARVLRDGVSPASVLVLAPARQAAARLRDLLSARLLAGAGSAGPAGSAGSAGWGQVTGTLREPIARTPHSYAFGVLRRSRVLVGDPAPVLISGPEQDRVLAELLAGHEEDAGLELPAPQWPETTDERIRSLRGFRDELRELLMRAVERGMSPSRLAALGVSQGRPDWVAAADVLGEYLDVTALATPGAYDPAGIIDAATAELAADPQLLAVERAERALVVVDDAHELTAATERLLRLLAGGRDLLLAGDPDATTQTFRGARPRLLADAPTTFGADRPAPVIVLGTAHRHGPLLRATVARVATRIGSSGLVRQRSAVPRAAEQADGQATDQEAGQATDQEDGQEDGQEAAESVAVRVLASPAREAAFVAQYLRRHHLRAGVPWSRMAVLVRSTKDTASIRRALGVAGVPVALPPAEVPVRDEPAVVPLRHALRCVLQPGGLTAEVAVDLLGSSLGGADAIGMRRLRHALRAVELAAGGGRGSDALLVEALAPERGGLLEELDPATAAAVLRVARVLAAGREAAAVPQANAETVLWALWSASGLAEGWRRMALGGGVSGARADRDLDAVMALFEAAGRFVDRFPRSGAAGFLEQLEGQEVPADTLAERAPDDDAVALVTAQGAVGREWDVVAVAGVQEGSWPDLRLRGSMLGAQRLADVVDGRAGALENSYVEQRRSVLDDELRLFHVAVGRARRHLLVTAVRSEDLLPSALIDLVDPAGAEQDLRPVAEVPSGLTLPALVASLRAVVVDGEATPARRVSAARQLARLAAAGVPGADPQDWYGLSPISVDGDLRLPEGVVSISPSAVESFERCALRWLLEQSGGRRPSSSAQELGNLVHELAEEVPDGDRERLQALLAERFDRIGLGHGWVAASERARAVAMIEKLVEYVRKASAAGRELVDTERSVRVEVGRATIRGTVDRLERDAQGRLVVVDLKTGKSAPAKAEVVRNAQLGVYQLAVEEGGFANRGEQPGGAELVQLGTSTKSVSVQQQPPLEQDPEPGWARDLVLRVADGMAGSQFAAHNNTMCRMCTLRRSCPAQLEGRQVTG